MGEPYLTADRLEDYKDRSRFDVENETERLRVTQELRDRQNAIIAMVHTHAEWCARNGLLDLDTVSGRVLSRAEAATLTADCVEDSLLQMLTKQARGELEELS